MATDTLYPSKYVDLYGPWLEIIANAPDGSTLDGIEIEPSLPDDVEIVIGLGDCGAERESGTRVFAKGTHRGKVFFGVSLVVSGRVAARMLCDRAEQRVYIRPLGRGID